MRRRDMPMERDGAMKYLSMLGVTLLAPRSSRLLLHEQGEAVGPTGA